MTLNTTAKEWLATNAGASNCFVSSGISYTDPDGISRTGGTADVLNALYVAHLIGKDSLVIRSGYNYTSFKSLNGNSDVDLTDITWAYANDGSPTGEAQYCYTAPTTGVLSFSSSPSGAEIYIDDVDQLKTTGPSSINITVSAATHTWKLTLSGYNNATGSQLVTAGQTYTINPTLTPIVTTGVLSFTSVPSGAEIYIDDVDQQQTTGASSVNISVSSGITHTWKLTLSGYNNATGSQLVVAGQTYTINPTLTPATGSINFVSSPTGANIRLGGVNTGFVTNKQIDNLSAGTYLYILTKAGYADKGGQVEVFAGSVSTVSVSLVLLPTNAKITMNDTFTSYNCYGFSIPKDDFACASASSLIKVHAIFSTGDCVSAPPVNQFIWYTWDLIQFAWTQYIQTPPLLRYQGYCRAEANLPCGNMYKVAYGTTEKIFTINQQSTPPVAPAAAAEPSNLIPLAIAVGAVMVVGIVIMSGKKA